MEKKITIKIKGKNYTFSSMVVWSIIELENFIRSRKIKFIQENITDSELSEKLIREATEKKYTKEEIGEWEASLEGQFYTLWSSLLKNHPDLKFEDLEMFLDIPDFNKFVNVVNSLTEKKKK